MKDERIRYDESFPHPILGTYSPRKVGMDILLNDGDSPEEALDRARKTVREWILKKDEESLHDVMPTSISGLPIIQREKNSNDFDREYEKDKHVIESLPYKEDAELFLKSSTFRLHAQLQHIVNNKPSKNSNG